MSPAGAALPASLPVLKSAARAIGRRPDLWPTALRSYRTLLPKGWWRHRPFLPLPDSRWLRFRLVTAYGGEGRFDGPEDAPIRAEDLVHWLEWQRSYPDR